MDGRAFLAILHDVDPNVSPYDPSKDAQVNFRRAFADAAERSWAASGTSRESRKGSLVEIPARQRPLVSSSNERSIDRVRSRDFSSSEKTRIKKSYEDTVMYRRAFSTP